MDLLQSPLYGNPVSAWLIAVGTALLTYVVFGLIARVAVGRLAQLARSTRLSWDDILASALERTKPFVILVVAVFVGAAALSLPESVTVVLRRLTMLALLVQSGIWASAAVTRWVGLQREQRGAADGGALMTMNVIGIAARGVVWSIVLLVALDNLGVDVTALVAGLGIGGVAVALAAQGILSDLFASLIIVLDRPFVPGDFLVVGDLMGSVREIGLKTTRMQSLSGEQLIFSNADLLNSRLRNYGRMSERRIAFKLGVTYETPRAKLEMIPAILREAVESSQDVRFDRAHFQAYGDFAIIFETVYFVLKPEYLAFMDIQQEINLRIHARFEAEGIEFAYPTQTVHLKSA